MMYARGVVMMEDSPVSGYAGDTLQDKVNSFVAHSCGDSSVDVFPLLLGGHHRLQPCGSQRTRCAGAT